MLQLTFTVGPADPAPFEEALLACGAVSITLEDAADNPVLEPAPGTTPLWPNVRIKALFEAAADPDVLTFLLEQQLPGRLPSLAFATLADRLWEREWLKDFRPMRFGKRLWICPGGQIDYGCGSGVLAIAALKLGAASAIAVDIDAQAITATVDNAQRNHVAQHIRATTVDAMPAAPADILLANILAEPLEALAASLSARVVPGGQLVLSGLLAEQAQRVAVRYLPWFDMAPMAISDGWARLNGVRRTDRR